jgi:hypothetical protein
MVEHVDDRCERFQFPPIPGNRKAAAPHLRSSQARNQVTKSSHANRNPQTSSHDNLNPKPQTLIPKHMECLNPNRNPQTSSHDNTAPHLRTGIWGFGGWGLGVRVRRIGGWWLEVEVKGLVAAGAFGGSGMAGSSCGLVRVVRVWFQRLRFGGRLGFGLGRSRAGPLNDANVATLGVCLRLA